MELPAGVQLESNQVNIEHLHPKLLNFMAVLGLVHYDLTGKPLVITSGNDGTHKPGSLHYVNRAFDYRTKDLLPVQEDQFVSFTYVLGHFYGLSPLDERAETGKQHVHVGYRGA